MQNLSCPSFQRCLLQDRKANGVSRELMVTARQFKLDFTFTTAAERVSSLALLLRNEMNLP